MASRPSSPPRSRLAGGSSATRLVLFDIDGTLVDCGPQVKPLFAAALEEAFGTSQGLDRYNFAGCTDSQAVSELMTAAGFSVGEIAERLPRAIASYLTRLETALDRGQMRLLPGVEPLLARLDQRGDVALALLTGNWEAGARTKLSRFDLNRYFPFGAFGSDAADRTDLPPIALARAEARLGRRFRPDEALIIGDSIHDVACGRAHGVPVLAVATGRTPAAALAAAGPDWLAADLEEAGEHVGWLGGEG
jgi:phosphoglycolate phosphatase